MEFDVATTTILMVKERLVAEWPETADGDTPSGPGDLKLILSGHLLDNAKTLAGAWVCRLFQPNNTSETSDSASACRIRGRGSTRGELRRGGVGSYHLWVCQGLGVCA
jgi:hypothetical protein